MSAGKLVSPFCLLLSLLMLVLAFILMATDGPQEGIQLHQARVVGNELLEDRLESDLMREIWIRRVLLAALFIGGMLMAFVAFFTIRGRS